MSTAIVQIRQAKGSTCASVIQSVTKKQTKLEHSRDTGLAQTINVLIEQLIMNFSVQEGLHQNVKDCKEAKNKLATDIQ